MKCNPEIEVIYGTREMSATEFQRAANAFAQLMNERLPPQIADAVRKIVEVRGVEPKPGFIQNELSVALANGVEVSVEGRCGKGKGIPIVRWHGQIVAHGFDGTLIRGAWERELSTALESIWHDEMQALALPGCADCHGFGTISDEGEYLACDCTARKAPAFAVHHGANQTTVVNEMAEQMAA